MKPQILKTERLILRPFEEAYVPQIVKLLSDPAISATTLNVPYPYDESTAYDWLAYQKKGWDSDEDYTFAVTRRDDGQFIGAISIRPEPRHQRAEVGYWMGVPYWGQGYATEATKAIIRFGFETLGYNRIYAYHFVGNPASGRVMQKAGMKKEGVLRQEVRKGDVFQDHAIYSILRQEWEK